MKTELVIHDRLFYYVARKTVPRRLSFSNRVLNHNILYRKIDKIIEEEWLKKYVYEKLHVVAESLDSEPFWMSTSICVVTKHTHNNLGPVCLPRIDLLIESGVQSKLHGLNNCRHFWFSPCIHFEVIRFLDYKFRTQKNPPHFDFTNAEHYLAYKRMVKNWKKLLRDAKK